MHNSSDERKPSTLYHLEPMNIFNGSIESLISYISRLSEAHCLPVKSMVDEIIWPNSTLPNYVNEYRSMFYKDHSKSINGVGIYANVFSSVLKDLTLRSELRYLTMLPLDGIIDSNGKGLLKNKREWCPLCYSEQLQKNGFIYDQLRWSLSPVERCDKHKIKLHNKCYACGKEQWSLVCYTPLGQCLHCGENLNNSDSIKNIHYEIIEDNTWIDWLERNLDTLFNMSSELDDKNSRESFCNTVGMIINDVSYGNSSLLDRKLGFGASTTNQWRKGINRPRFDYLLQFAFRLGADLIDILNYDKKSGCDIFIKTESTNSFVKLSRGERKQHNHEKIEHELDRVLKNNIPKSAANIMAKFEVSHGYLNYRFPKKIRKISENYKQYLKEKNNKKFTHKADFIRQIIKKLHEQNVYPSRNKVFKEAKSLNDKLSSNYPLREIWRTEMIKLGYLGN